MEVFLRFGSVCSGIEGLLHVRGGVSITSATSRVALQSSPRPWRCFPIEPVRKPSVFVFSTSVEVFPSRPGHQEKRECLLHVRGGVSRDAFLGDRSAIVFSTSVEVFLSVQAELTAVPRLLHVRGGVSNDKTVTPKLSQSSPRPWRCFRRHRRESS